MLFEKEDILTKLQEKVNSKVERLRQEMAEALFDHLQEGKVLYFVFSKKEKDVVGGPFDSASKAGAYIKEMDDAKDLVVMEEKDLEKIMGEAIKTQHPKFKFKIDFSENLVDNFERWAGKPLQVGRNLLRGFPVDVEDSDGTFLEMVAVDSDAAKLLMKELRAAGFIVKIARGNELSIDLPAKTSE